MKINNIKTITYLICAAIAAAIVLIRVQIVCAENESAAAITLGGLLEYAKNVVEV
jgi:hypothetical protein